MDVPNGLYMLGWGGSGTFTPALHFVPTLLPDGSFSTTDDPELTSLIQKGSATLDDTERADIFTQAQKRAYDQASRLFLFQQSNIYGISEKVKGFTPRADSLLDFGSVSA
jgi:ABC-type transport system substrate-binding protein